MADKTGMRERLSMLEAEDNERDSEIELCTNSEKGVNIADCIDDGNGFSSIWTDVPLDSRYIEYDSEDTEKDESANTADCVDDGNELLSDWVDLTIADAGGNLLTISLAVVHLVDGE